ncbi:hypothetical protein K0M31_015287 [Melipona bicolor]|uniref:Transcription cofactor vestigial-like protein 4 n=1 Tax=Melipona bicolor TaxID=60889 RepID=A0AA40FFW8_9HYME|nr:hypothetical protein K0M31_015287 [Melipona bicolor]
MTPEDFWKHGGLAEEKVPLAAVAHYGQLSNSIQTRRKDSIYKKELSICTRTREESHARFLLFYCAEERPKTTNLHRKPSSAWRKERRRDPIQSEALDMTAARVHHHHHSRPSVIVPTTPQPGTTIEDTAVTPTPSLTPSAAAGGQRTGVRTVGGVSDPAIDEHFKRSLGLEEYAAVFNATTTDKEAGLSVDDHFAKALGETWTRLQATSRSKDST